MVHGSHGGAGEDRGGFVVHHWHVAMDVVGAWAEGGCWLGLGLSNCSVVVPGDSSFTIGYAGYVVVTWPNTLSHIASDNLNRWLIQL